ncbi:hypothetical protein Bpfe_019807 [Biomphalaria pfeifferi]|uniref:Uncharacterized protein n=1 Tax=Biomphalaria pfeifferi TaxID=112525 RepID=A0AAD8B9Y1_BIOPF|nr:hypothetical protein Bpfe_019807 [Biomphalaria pfeifferi]
MSRWLGDSIQLDPPPSRTSENRTGELDKEDSAREKLQNLQFIITTVFYYDTHDDTQVWLLMKQRLKWGYLESCTEDRD